MVTYRVHFIRHGMTEGNRDGRYVGRRDLPLCPEGAQEVRNMAVGYSYPEVDAVYSSPLLRCRQTAEILYPDQQLTVVEDLIEMSFGDFEGRSIAQLRGLPEFEAWIRDSMHNTPPGAAETGEEFARRIGMAMQAIIMDMTQNGIKSAAVIAHGGVIMGLLSAFALPRLPLGKWAVGNCEGYTVSFNTQNWMRDGVFEVVGSIPEGREPGGNPWVMESLGASD